MRLKSREFKHPLLDPAYVEAWMLTLEGVTGVRINPKAASLIITHDKREAMLSTVIDRLRNLPPGAFSQKQKREKHISRSALATHLGVVLVSPFIPAPLRLVLALCVGLPVIFDGIRHFLSTGITAKSLDAVSISICFALNNYATLTLISFMRIFGDYLKQQNDLRSNELLIGLLRHKKKTVWIDAGGVEVEVDAVTVHIGDIVICYSGELVAIDGEIVKGTALVNRSMISGESFPVHLGQGEHIISGSLVESGKIWIKATQVGDKTFLSKVYHFLEKSLHDKSMPEQKGEKLADRLVPINIGLSALTGIVTGDLSRTAAIASIDYVCSVKFPGAFSVKSSMCAAAKAGILLKGGSALDGLAQIDTIVFDKTGTLTLNTLNISDIITANDITDNEILSIAAGLEQHCSHPLADAIVHGAGKKGIAPKEVRCSKLYVSRGMSGSQEGKEVLIGNKKFVTAAGCPATYELESAAEKLRAQGKIVLYLGRDKEMNGLVALEDTIRPEACETIEMLKMSGVRKVIILTGDHKLTAEHLGSRIDGIDEIHAELMPQDKADIVTALKNQGHCVAVVGDGINDAPALSVADVGICMDHGGDLSRAAAQALILSNDLGALVIAREIALREYGILNRYYYQGFVVNTALLTLALSGVLAPFGAAFLHNLNTLFLIGYSTINASRSIKTGPKRSLSLLSSSKEFPDF